MKQGQKQLIAASAFLIAVPLICHFAFSWMGFTPTDEGAYLAHSRRLLDGQVPHRDFTLIRPALTPLLHVPFVLLGDYAFWLSRLFVWVELAVFAWLSVSVINRMLAVPFSVVHSVLAALICFAATTHTKHITAWSTIDGLFFFALGLALAIKKSGPLKIAGYFLIGLAPLCKQSFIFMAPLSILILSDWRKVKYWLAVLAPGLVYLLFLLATNSLDDARTQLFSHTELTLVGLFPYLRKRVVLMAILALVCARFAFGRSRLSDSVKRSIATVMFYAAPMVCVAISLWFGILMHTSYLLFGFVVGATLYVLTDREAATSAKQIFLLVTLLAWSVSLSIGYNSPGLVSGPVMVLLMGYLFFKLRPVWSRSLQYSLWILTVLIVLSFTVGRVNYVYRDRRAPELTKSLTGVMRGGARIYTNPNTYDFLVDLNRAVALAKGDGKRYAILPDCAAYWVEAPEQNPLPVVWPVGQEVSSPAIYRRVIDAIESNRGHTVFIVQKVEATTLPRAFLPLQTNDFYAVVRYTKTNFTKTRETAYFELYE